jgi:hypothetical protein
MVRRHTGRAAAETTCMTQLTKSRIEALQLHPNSQFNDAGSIPSQDAHRAFYLAGYQVDSWGLRIEINCGRSPWALSAKLPDRAVWPNARRKYSKANRVMQVGHGAIRQFSKFGPFPLDARLYQDGTTALDHDPIRLNRIMISSLCLSMIFSENRFALFRIML